MKILSVLFVALFLSISTSAHEAQLRGRTVFDFKARYGSVTPQERATLLERRLNELVSLPELQEEAFKTVDEGEVQAVRYGDTVLLVVSSEDALEAGKEKALLAHETLSTIKTLVNNERDKKEPMKLLTAGGLILLTTAVLILLLRLLGVLRRKGLAKVSAWEFSIKTALLKNIPFVNDQAVKRVIIFLIRAINVAIIFMAFYIYVPVVFSFLPWTSGWSETIFDYVLRPLVWVWHGLQILLPNLFFILVIAVLTRYLLRAVRFIFDEIRFGRLKVDGFYPEWADPTYKLVRVLIFMMAFVVCFPYIPGSSSPAFQGLSVFLGLLVSLGSSSAIANIVAGVVITYMRPFKVGDRVKISDTMGDVVEKDLLVTRLRTVKQMEVTIPNSMILASHIINYSSQAREGGIILNTSVTIGYDVPWNNVHKALLEAARRTENVLNDPKPFILQTALNDFNVAYELNSYTHEEHLMLQTYSDLHMNIQITFAEAGIEIMSPNYLAMRDGNQVTIPKL
ncbi:Mechanosensitive channel MscK precursor [compost metagenome]